MELRVFSFALIVSALLGGWPPLLCRGDDEISTRSSSDSSTSSASSSQPESPAVILRAVPQSSRVRLGQCRFGESFSATLPIHNRSSMRLSLSRIDPDCGCLSIEPDRTLFDDGETLRLRLQLAPSHKLARIRRTVRVFFDEVTAPLLLKLDLDVIGPFQLKQTQLEVGSRDQTVLLQGSKTEAGLTLVSIASGRGSFFIDKPWTQDDNSFACRLRPAIAFGSSVDSLQLTYRDQQSGLHTVQLPVQIRITEPARFLPSTIQLTAHQNQWHGKARLILTPAAAVRDPHRVRFVPRRGDQQIDSDDVVIAVEPVSSVLWMVYISIDLSQDKNDSSILPDHIDVLDAKQDRLGTLVLAGTSP